MRECPEDLECWDLKEKSREFDTRGTPQSDKAPRRFDSDDPGRQLVSWSLRRMVQRASPMKTKERGMGTEDPWHL